MHVIIVACTLLVVGAAVVPDESKSEILAYENTNEGKGNYKFSFGTSNGINREETGRLLNAGEDNEHIVVEGLYSYTDPDGKLIIVRYTADENGYRILDSPTPEVAFAVPANVVASLLGK